MKTVSFLLILVVVAANWFLHLHIARSNASVHARLRVLKAYQFKWGLISLGCLMVVSLFLMLFMEPNVHWVVKLLLSVFVLRMLYMNIVCVKVSNNIILDGNAITIVKDGDISELNAAIHEKQIDVNNPSRRGGFPLLTAVARNEFEKAKLLLSNGANVNAVHREDGITALSSAVLLGNMNMISLLFERGADPNIRGNNNASLPLTLAAALGFDEVVKTLLEHGVQIDAKGSSQSVTALAVAASAGRVNIVRQLLEAGAEPNVVDANGFSPLHHAVQVSSPSDAVGHPGFQQAEQRDSVSIVRDHQAVVELLLSSGADPNRQTPDGATALHMAAKEGHVEIVKELIERGAKRDIPVVNGQTALDLAVMSGQRDTTPYLRSVDAPEGSFNKDATVSAMNELRSLRKSNNATVIENLSTLRLGKTSDAKQSGSVVSHKHDVFLSYSILEKETAKELCNYFESNRLSCWIAARDVRAGEAYSSEIVTAIENSELFFLLLTENANKSEYVITQVNIAINNRKTIITFRLGDFVLNKELEYSLSKSHWIVGGARPDKSYSLLLTQIQLSLGIKEKKEDLSAHRQGKTSDAKPSGSVVSQEHDVFLSYSSKNKQTADAICHVLEQNKIKCWIAPRDISIGEKYGNVIVQAICACKVFIIVFSKDSSLSSWVESELNLAFNERRVIMPFRIDNTNIEGEMRLILNNRHWIDAYPEPEVHFAKLVSAVERQVGLPLSSFNSSFPNDIIQQTQDTKLGDEDTDSEKQKEH